MFLSVNELSEDTCLGRDDDGLTLAISLVCYYEPSIFSNLTRK